MVRGPAHRPGLLPPQVRGPGGGGGCWHARAVSVFAYANGLHRSWRDARCQSSQNSDRPKSEFHTFTCFADPKSSTSDVPRILFKVSGTLPVAWPATPPPRLPEVTADYAQFVQHNEVEADAGGAAKLWEESGQHLKAIEAYLKACGRTPFSPVRIPRAALVGGWVGVWVCSGWVCVNVFSFLQLLQVLEWMG